jgi:hypothetical protein
MITVALVLVLGLVFGGAAGFIVGYFVGRRTATHAAARGFPVTPPREHSR